MYAANEITIIVGSERYNWYLESTYKLQQLKLYIQTLPDLPYPYSIVCLNNKGIPQHKISSQEDLDKHLNSCLQSGIPPEVYIMISNFSCFEFKTGESYDDETTKQIEGEELKGVIKDLGVIKYNAKKELNGEVINFLVGRTGQGKSTLTNHLQGCQFVCQRVKGRYHLTPIVPEYLQNIKTAEIGNDVESCTSLPGYYLTVSQQNICDLAGFVDTKGIKQQIRNSFSNTQIFIKGKMIRIILVIECATIYGQRGQSFINTIDRLKNLFPNQFEDNVMYCCGLIVTKVTSQQEKQDIMEQLLKICEEKSTLKEEYKNFIKYIVHEKRVAIVRTPLKVNKDQYQMNFEDNIFQFIQAIPIAELREDSNISLSEQAKLGLKKIMEKIQITLENQINELVLKYPYQMNNSEKFEELSMYCYTIDEAIKKLSPPYDIDQIIKAFKMLGLKVNFKEIQNKIGTLFRNLYKLFELLPTYECQFNLFDNLIASLLQKQKTFHLKMENFFESQEVKAMAEQKMRELEAFGRQIQMKKLELVRNNQARDQANRKAISDNMARLNQELKNKNQEQLRQIQRIKQSRR